MIHFEYKPENNLLFSVFCGEITGKELTQHINKLLAGNYKTQSLGLSVFCAHSSTKKLLSLDVFTAGNNMRKASFRENGKHAIVTRSTVSYGLARAYQIATELSDVDETKVYKASELSDAIQWLGLTEIEEELIKVIRHCESPSV